MNEEHSKLYPEAACNVCGVQCSIYPNPPGKAVCEEHCEDHEYEYDKWRLGKFCVYCDKQKPYD